MRRVERQLGRLRCGNPEAQFGSFFAGSTQLCAASKPRQLQTLVMERFVPPRKLGIAGTWPNPIWEWDLERFLLTE